MFSKQHHFFVPWTPQDVVNEKKETHFTNFGSDHSFLKSYNYENVKKYTVKTKQSDRAVTTHAKLGPSL